MERTDGLKCSENALILCFTGLSSTILLLTSMFCLSQRSRSAVLQCSIVSVYISFLTASALAAFPPKEIHGSIVSNVTATVVTTKLVKCRNYAIFGLVNEQMEIGTAYLFNQPSIIVSGGAIENINHRAHYVPPEQEHTEVTMDHLMRAAAIAFAIVSGAYSSFRNGQGRGSNASKIPGNPFLLACCVKRRENGDDNGEERDDESTGVQYNYCVMHLIYASATLYMMMTLTNWYEPEHVYELFAQINRNATMLTDGGGGGLEAIADGSNAIFWVKSATAATCQLLFLIIVFGRLCKFTKCHWFRDATDYE